MANDEFLRGPNIFHPEKPSAVGSRNSLLQEGRDKFSEARLIIDEEIDKIINSSLTKLPPEVLEKKEVMASIKDKLYNYVNITYQNMFNRYINTVEDEMLKKTRDFIDKEEYRNLARYTPREITDILDKLGGIDKFNTSEMEKSVVNMYGHLQGHIQRGVTELENETNALLRQRTYVGAAVRGENAYSIVKCSFKDDPQRPESVYNVKLSINVLESELISPIFHFQGTYDYIIKDVISKHIENRIENEINAIQDELIESGDMELSTQEVIFKKISMVTEYTDDENENESSLRYNYINKRILDKLSGLRSDISSDEFDSLNIRENIKKILDSENVKNRGFNTAVNTLTSILDSSKMGYQYIENLKNARSLTIREYENTSSKRLPDERYSIQLTFYDQEQLVLLREAYDKQASELQNEIVKLSDVVQTLYETKKSFRSVNDFEDLFQRVKRHILDIKRRENPDFEEDEKIKEWNETYFVKPEESEIESQNRTYEYDFQYEKNLLKEISNKIQSMYGHQNPVERIVLAKRLERLEQVFNQFFYEINPHHILPGLLLDIDIVSIKKLQSTLYGMAGVLNEFLHSISKGFHDTAFASFERRRATIREDIERSFSQARGR